MTPAFLKEVQQFVRQLKEQAQLEVELTVNDTDKCAFLILDKNANKQLCFMTLDALRKDPVPELPLLHLEDEWYRNKQAVQSRIFSLLQVTQRIHGRQCEIRRMNKTEAAAFIGAHHSMGYANSHFHYGLFHKDEAVAVAAFSKGRSMRRLPMGKRSFELVRFCNKSFTTVVGGLSKLIGHFIKEHKPGDIFTYVDTSWSDPKTYFKQGFICKEHLSPITFYINTKTYERVTVKNFDGQLNTDWVHYTNKGNLKLIKTIHDENDK